MHVSSVDETLKLYNGKDTYRCDNVLPRFCHNNYTYFKIINNLKKFIMIVAKFF